MLSGETNLQKLLAGMKPELQAGEFVYVVLPPDAHIPVSIRSFGSFVEKEGTTLIVERREAERLGLSYAFPCRIITLTVHSSLDAVGFLAAIAQALAAADIPANTISAYYHDHLLIPTEKAEQAMATLSRLAEARKPTPP